MEVSNNINNEVIQNIENYLNEGLKQGNQKSFNLQIKNISNIQLQINELLNKLSSYPLPSYVKETNELLKIKFSNIMKQKNSMDQTLSTFLELKAREGQLNDNISLKRTEIEGIFTGINKNEVSKQYLKRPSLSGGSKKKIYMKKEQKKPSKKKTTIKTTSLKMKSSQLKTTKKK